MTDNEKAQNELLENIKKQVTEQIKGLSEGTIKADEVEKKFAEISKTVNENFTSKDELANVTAELQKAVEEAKELREIVKNQGTQINELKAGKQQEKSDTPIYFVDAMEKSMRESGLIEKSTVLLNNNTNKEVEKLKIDLGNQRQSWKFTLPENTIFSKKEVNKVVVDQSITNTMGSDADRILIAISPRLSQIPLSNNVHAIDVFDSENINTDNYGVLVQYTETDGTDVVAEETANGQSSFLLKLVRFETWTVGTHYKTTEELISDWPRFIAEMNRRTPNNIMEELDSKVYGTETDQTAGIVGLANSTWSATIDFAGADSGLIPSDLGAANTIADVIHLAAGKATNANYMPDAVIMNDVDVRGLEAQKNTDADSVQDRRMVFQGGLLVAIAGLRVIRNRNITANTAIIVQSDEVTIVKRTEIEMAMNYDEANDFTKRMPTFRFTMRALNAPRNAATGSTIWISDLSQAITDLNAAS